MTVHDMSIPWLSLLALGAVHGVNPAMGWLFAVGRGLQERDRRAILRALGPLAIGHALAIGAAVIFTIALGQLVPLGWLRWIVGAALFLVGVDGLMRHRHIRLGGMRASARELATWSFLMASAHGAGLMVVPFVLGTVGPKTTDALHHHHAASASGDGVEPMLAAGLAGVDAIGLIAPLIHTLGYLIVTVILAVVVYEKLGLRILRRAWINLNAVWSVALIAAAVAAVVS